MVLYERYAKMAHASTEEYLDDSSRPTTLAQKLSQLRVSFDYCRLATTALYTNDSVFAVALPVVCEKSRNIYEECARIARQGPKTAGFGDQYLYSQYRDVGKRSL